MLDLLGQSVVVPALLVCIVGADGNTQVGAERSPGRRMQEPARLVPAVKPLALDDLVFMACRDRRGVAAYLWCNTDSAAPGTARSSGRSDRLAAAHTLDDEAPARS